MTDKERLEEARLMAEMLRVETRLPHDFPFDLVDWLVEQAERVQELEEDLLDLVKQNKELRKSIAFYSSESYNAHLERLLDRSEKQIKRYREAIEEAIEKLTWNSVESEKILLKALEESE